MSAGRVSTSRMTLVERFALRLLARGTTGTVAAIATEADGSHKVRYRWREGDNTDVLRVPALNVAALFEAGAERLRAAVRNEADS